MVKPEDYYQELFDRARYKLKSIEDTEDAVQETYLQYYLYKDTSFKLWSISDALNYIMYTQIQKTFKKRYNSHLSLELLHDNASPIDINEGILCEKYKEALSKSDEYWSKFHLCKSKVRYKIVSDILEDKTLEPFEIEVCTILKIKREYINKYGKRSEYSNYRIRKGKSKKLLSNVE